MRRGKGEEDGRMRKVGGGDEGREEAEEGEE